MQVRKTVIGVVLMLPLALATSAAQSPTRLDTMKVVEEKKEPQRGGRNLLTSEELLAKDFTNVYEALQALRPFWLRARGPSRMDPSGQAPTVKIYLDNVALGTVDELRVLSVRTIRRLSFMTGPDAQARYGVGHENGAIVIETIGDKKAP
jgi:hypothetical protein